MMILRRWAAVAACVLSLTGTAQPQGQADPPAGPQTIQVKPVENLEEKSRGGADAAPTVQNRISTPSSREKTDSLEIPGAKKSEPKKDDANPAGNTVVQGGADQAPQDQGGGGNRRQSDDGVGVVHSDGSSPEALTAKFTLWLFIATLFLAVATFSLALSTRGLYRQTERLADEAVKQGEKAERQIEISVQSARAAEIAAQAASDSVAAERAWVMLETFQFGSAVDSQVYGKYYDNACLITSAWRNSGRSPAMNAKFFLTHQLVKKGDKPTNFVPPDMSIHNGVVLPPNQLRTSVFTVISHDEFVKIRNQELSGFIYACCEYFETPESKVPKRSEFCGQIAMVEFKPISDGAFNYEMSISSWGSQNTAT